VIGRGSFGKVIQVRKRDTGDIFAMKVLKKEVIIRENMIGHTKQEKSILQRIQHPFIVNLKFAFQTPEKLYLVMEYLGGGELFFHLKKDGRFKEDRARFYTSEITMAIEHLHNNSIIYRDLKPENIVLSHDGHLGLTDFGLAKTFISSGAPTYTFCGTPEYLAPEILMGVGHNKAVDWWSLGVLLYEMLTGIPPFYSENVNEMYELILKAPLHFPEYVSPNARSVLKGLLERDPKNRLGSGPTDGAEIRAHPFFATIDWSDLFDKKIRPAFIPSKTDADKGEYFDEEFTTERAVDSFAEVTKDSETSFQGFTYTGESALSKADK
jgi:serum/glucocorticoid-regulated kinase 2